MSPELLMLLQRLLGGQSGQPSFNPGFPRQPQPYQVVRPRVGGPQDMGMASGLAGLMSAYAPAQQQTSWEAPFPRQQASPLSSGVTGMLGSYGGQWEAPFPRQQLGWDYRRRGA